MDIKITVKRKLPICGDVAIVCNNSDYTVIWELDEEWSGYDTKTMRTVYKDGTYTDTVFTGDTVALPVVTMPGQVKIGLYAGDIRTSRAALIRALPSVTSDGGAPAAPSEDVYNQLMNKLNALSSPSPKLFYTEDEVVAELVTLNDDGDVGYKDVAVYTQQETSSEVVYYIGDSENRKNWFEFKQSEDGSELVFKRWQNASVIDLTIISSEKLANGLWMVTLKNNNKSTYAEIRSKYDIPIGINLLPEGVAIGGIYTQRLDHALTTLLYVDPTDHNRGYVSKSAVSVRSQSKLREAVINKDAYVISCDYDNAPFDVVFVKSYGTPSTSYARLLGVGFKDGVYGSIDVVVNSSYESFFSATFKPQSTSGSLLITLTPADGSGPDNPTYTADVDFEDIVKAIKSGVPTMFAYSDEPSESANIFVVTGINIQDASTGVLFAINDSCTVVFGVSGTNWTFLEERLLDEATYADFSPLALSGTKVGQILRVAEVDDDGVPMAWEAVDMPNGTDGFSPTASVSETDTGATITITDKTGTTTATVKNGKDGKDGAPGKDGKDGAPGKDGTNGTNGTNGKDGKDGTDGITPTIGDNGNWYLGDEDTGKPSRGAAGTPGKDGVDGKDGAPGKDGTPGTPGKDGAGIDIIGASAGQYVKISAVDADGKPTAWTAADMDASQMVPLFANSLEELQASGDTSKLYVLPDGYIYAYRQTTTEETVTITDPVTATTENPYHAGCRFGSSAAADTFESDAGGYVVTPLIDMTKAAYVGKTIKLHLEGLEYITEAVTTWIQARCYKYDKSIVMPRGYATEASTDNSAFVAMSNLTIDRKSATESVLTINVPMQYGGAKVPIGYLRFCAKGAEAQSNIYITYEVTQAVTKTQWTSTGVQFVGGGASPELAAKVAALNNEGADAETVALLPSVVQAFYASAAYPDNDYTTTHLTKITYPCRADIPVPYTVKWPYNETAMRTIVAVDTKPIGTANYYTLRTYDVTGLKKFPIYNLIPGTAYYYKVTHVMADGSLIDAKSGSFTASSNAPWRLLYIDGTQNVRDLGGWTGLNGKRVKYGKIIRGAALSDSSASDLIVTGKGRLALADLKIQAELNLGAADTETSIAASCAYKKIGYSNYADAITAASARTQFKEALEWIVACLDGSLSQSGLPQVQRNIYMHCQGGCDRTGTLSFLLLGLLGVSESDLAKEYELSSFSVVGMGRLRNTVKAVDVYDYSGMVAALKTYSGDTLAAKFESFATACGVSADTISSFRTLMLEEVS